MNNLYLVQVTDKFGTNAFLPLAICYQWMYAQTDSVIRANFQVSDVLIEKQSVKDYVDSITDYPHVVAMSCYIWNWEYNKTLALEIKKKYPDCLIVVGGPNIDKRDTAFFLKHPQFDVAVLGEGELAFKEILHRYLDKKQFDNIPKVMTPVTGYCGLPERDRDINHIPSPILTGFYDFIIEKFEQKNGPQSWQIAYETLRGCPYSCTFCDIGDSYWNKITKFDLERIKAEIDWMSRRKIEYVAVCDSNWGMLPRDKEIIEYIIKKKLETGYPEVWDATWAKASPKQVYEIAKLDKEAGTNLFKGITFSVQTLTSVTEKAIKRSNIKQDVYVSYMNQYEKDDIPTYTELIWPMPDETYQSFKGVIQKLIDLGQKGFITVNALQVTFNAEMGQKEYQEKYGMKLVTVPLDTYHIQVDDIDNYIIENTMHVVETNTASYEDIMRGHVFTNFVTIMFYFGWAHYLMEYMNNKHQIKHTNFIEEFIEYFLKHKDTLLGNEVFATKTLLEESTEGKKIWGRLLPNDNTLWRYETATSMILHKNRDQLKQDLVQFVADRYNIDVVDVVEFNLDAAFDYRTNYPFVKEYSEDTLKYTIGLDTGKVEIDHFARYDNECDFFRETYQYKRKNKWWKCYVRPAN